MQMWPLRSISFMLDEFCASKGVACMQRRLAYTGLEVFLKKKKKLKDGDWLHYV